MSRYQRINESIVLYQYGIGTVSVTHDRRRGIYLQVIDHKPRDVCLIDRAGARQLGRHDK